MASGRPDDAAARFESRYRVGDEPWEFSGRGAEVLRHQSVVQRVRAQAPQHVLDVGCSLGQLTAALAALPVTLSAMDVSPTAVRRTRERFSRDAGAAVRPPSLLVGSATSLPLEPGTFDVVVASDGLVSWDLSIEQRAVALREFHAVLRKGRHLLLTEYLRPQQFGGFIDEVEASPFQVVSIDYLYDRPWYKLESWFKGICGTRLMRPIRRNLLVAKGLRAVGRLFGPAGSRHIVVLARKA